ncbi:MAG: hypothetical protein GX037_06500 [Trueperella sp.]|nr:hypothetical protein [Trueperella sp.]
MNKNDSNKNFPHRNDDVAPGAEEIGAEEHRAKGDQRPDRDVTAPGADRIGATDSPNNETVYEDDTKPAGVDDAVAPGAENIGATTKDNPGK